MKSSFRRSKRLPHPNTCVRSGQPPSRDVCCSWFLVLGYLFAADERTKNILLPLPQQGRESPTNRQKVAFRGAKGDNTTLNTENLPVVSIVTPSFNQGRFVEQTIQSVLAQDYPKIEYMVIDGGSTDGSAEIIRRYETRLAYWVSEPDRGQTCAIHKGFARATGSILAWLNSDDLLAPSAVRIAVEYLRAEAGVGLVYGDRLHIDFKGNVTGVNRMPASLRHARPQHYAPPGNGLLPPRGIRACGRDQ